MDKFSQAKRSEIMSKIGSKNTKPEKLIFAELKQIHYRKQYPIPGKPDIAFPKLKIAVFINGEFWHGRNLNKYRDGLSDFWINKIEGNVARDRKNYRELRKKGWSIITLWDKNIYENPSKEAQKIIKLKNLKEL